jgi:hypothetical protein
MFEDLLQDLTYRFAKEDNVGFHEASAALAPRDSLFLDMNLEQEVVIGCLTIDTSLRSETSVSFYNFGFWNSGTTFKGIDILRETF